MRLAYCKEMGIITPTRTQARLQAAGGVFTVPCVQQPYSNAAIALYPIDQRKKVPGAMQHRNPGESLLWSQPNARRMAATQDHPTFSDYLCEEEQWRIPANN